LLQLEAQPYRVRGVSVGGVYTSLQVPELSAVFDVGMPLRSFAATPQIFLSHAHADHIGALVTLLGIRGMMQVPPPKVFVPAPVLETVQRALDTFSELQRHALTVELIGMTAGEEHEAEAAMRVRAFRTHHTVPSLGYQFLRRVQKLREAYRGLPGDEIRQLREAGEEIFDVEERLEFAYATDTLVRVLDTHPELYRSRVLMMECTFLDEKKGLPAVHAGCHIHLDEIIERAERFENEHLILMHFSQLYAPREVHEIIERRVPPSLRERVRVFAPKSGPWPG